MFGFNTESWKNRRYKAKRRQLIRYAKEHVNEDMRAIIESYPEELVQPQKPELKRKIAFKVQGKHPSL